MGPVAYNNRIYKHHMVVTSEMHHQNDYYYYYHQHTFRYSLSGLFITPDQVGLPEKSPKRNF